MITREVISGLLTYDKESGWFTRLTSGHGNSIGDRAGCLGTGGYRYIKIDGRLYSEHRLAWIYVNGSSPEGQIDHINGVRSDNRLCNLRDVTVSQNQQNRRKAASHSKSGILGVSVCKQTGKWTAHIQLNGKQKNLGRFSELEDARSAYMNAKRDTHPFGEIARSP